MHILTMLFHTQRKALIMLPAKDEFKEVRENMISFLKFYEDKIVACSVKPKEG